MSTRHDEATRQPPKIRKTTPPIIEGYIPKELRPIPPVGFQGHGGYGMEGFEAVFGVSVREPTTVNTMIYRINGTDQSNYPPTSIYPSAGQPSVDPWAYPTTFPPQPVDARPRAFPVPPPTIYYTPQPMMGQQSYPYLFPSQLGPQSYPNQDQQARDYQPPPQLAQAPNYPQSALLPKPPRSAQQSGNPINLNSLPHSSMPPPSKSNTTLLTHPRPTKKSKVPTPITIPSQSQSSSYPNFSNSNLLTPYTALTSASVGHPTYVGYPEPLTPYPITPLESIFPNTPLYPYETTYNGSEYSSTAEGMLQGQGYQPLGYTYGQQGMGLGGDQSNWSDLGTVPDLVPSSTGTAGSMDNHSVNIGKSTMISPQSQSSLESSYLKSFEPLLNPLHRPSTIPKNDKSALTKVESKVKSTKSPILQSTKLTTSTAETIKGKTRRSSALSPKISNVVAPSVSFYMIHIPLSQEADILGSL